MDKEELKKKIFQKALREWEEKYYNTINDYEQECINELLEEY